MAVVWLSLRSFKNRSPVEVLHLCRNGYETVTKVPLFSVTCKPHGKVSILFNSLSNCLIFVRLREMAIN